MHLDIPTLAVVTVFVTALLGVLLLFAGAQNRSVRAPTIWGLSFLLGATGLGLVIVRGRVPDWLSIECANALMLAGMSLIWTGARLFDRRPVGLAHVATVPALWFVACLVHGVGGDIHVRTMLYSVLAAMLSVLTARELWRGRGEPLLSRWPTVLTLLGYATAMLALIPATVLMPQIAMSPNFLSSALYPAFAFGTLMFTIILAFLLLNMSKERTELQHKMASLVDPLSGVANRRAFLAGAEQIVAQSAAGDHLGVMLFDLDHFKAINDANGHATGDAVIKLFAREATRTLGHGALFGRIGGEEFGALMRVSDGGDAVAVAQRIRLTFASAAARSGLGVLPTVSIGVAIAGGAADDVEGLLAAADRALYRAKANGRNRVEYPGAPDPEAAAPVPRENFRETGPEGRAVGA
ncbi:MAG TPA: GGDEF domain-containing protein [Pseudolabrys sp.]|nr:GGDEF domain-containing protein [Pseudolabrys sp.]